MNRSLPDLLCLPDVPVEVLQNPPLIQALCQVQFTRVLGVADTKFVAPFQRAIEAQYPIVSSEVPVLEVVLGAGEPQSESIPRSTRWRFSDRGDNWVAVLAEDFLAVETRTYESFSDFLNRLKEVLSALVQHIRPGFGTRIGLRYVNEIRTGSADWAAVICRELLGPLAEQGLTGNASQVQAIQQVVLRFPDGQGVNIRHGLLPSGTTIKPREGEKPSDGPFYLLDFDAYRTFPVAEAFSMDPGEMCQHVDSFNKVIYRLFRWATTNEYISTLRTGSHE